jgi:predicted transcriptional regulator
MSSKIVKATGAQIGGARQYLRISQADLAKIADVSDTTVNMFEAGTRTPHESTRQKLQEALERRGIVFTNGDKPGFYFDKEKVIIPT